MLQFSWLLQMHAPAFLIFSPYGAIPPWDHSSILMNSWPKSRAFKLSFCALKCCLIFGFTKPVCSMRVATTFSWKAARFWLSPSLHVCETSDGWTSPTPSTDSLIMNCKQPQVINSCISEAHLQYRCNKQNHRTNIHPYFQFIRKWDKCNTCQILDQLEGKKSQTQFVSWNDILSVQN